MNKYWLFGALISSITAIAQNPIAVQLDLNQIDNDRLVVEMNLGKIKEKEVIFYIPATIPGTYSIDNYGRFVSQVKGTDSKGKPVEIERLDNNSWKIKDAKKLTKLVYTVDDTFDYNSENVPFAPAGTQIDPSTFLLNLHAFVGYFKGQEENDYTLSISHSKQLHASSSINDSDPSNEKAVYQYDRYFDVTDNPIFFTKTAPLVFNVDGVEVILAVHSPTGKYSPADFQDAMRIMIQAQLNFIGPIRTTNRYAILLYLASDQYKDATEYGALEHHKNTTVVFPEAMSLEELTQNLIDTVSHEFFHILTPLAIHSNEIHFFNYNDPKMSQHLWLYEGVTEYFANLFQVDQGLINEQEFLERMTEKREYAANFTDDMSFTEMSKNVLIEPYADEFLNVYSKGSLIAMCIDILIRKDTQGEKGIIHLMRELSQVYGPDKPFNDDDLFKEIEQRTSVNVGNFLRKHVQQGEPIAYDEFLHQMGVGNETSWVDTLLWDNGDNEMILDYKGFGQYLQVKENVSSHLVVKTFGLEANDQLVSLNGTDANILSNFENFLLKSMEIKTGDEVTIEVLRGAERLTKKAIITLPQREVEKWTVKKADHPLRKAWLNQQ